MTTTNITRCNTHNTWNVTASRDIKGKVTVRRRFSDKKFGGTDQAFEEASLFKFFLSRATNKTFVRSIRKRGRPAKGHYFGAVHIDMC